MRNDRISQLLRCLVFFTITYACVAQTPSWRLEDLGLPPQAVTLRVMNGHYMAETFDGYYRFDDASDRWVYLGTYTDSVTTLPNWLMQTTGMAVDFWSSSQATLRFDAGTGNIERRPGITYQAEYGDSLIGKYSTRLIDQNTRHRVIVRWFTWPSLDLLQADSVDLENDGQPIRVTCADTSMLAVMRGYLIKFSYKEAPQRILMPDSIYNLYMSEFIDDKRTHVVISTPTDWVYSADHGRSWSILPGMSRNAVPKVVVTEDPDIVLATTRSVLFRYHISTSRRDTLYVSPSVNSLIQVAHGPLGTMVYVDDAVFLIDDVTNERRVINTGLPQRGVYDLIAVPDGVAATSAIEIVLHPSGGDWMISELDPDKLLKDLRFGMTMAFYGGRNLDDLWFLDKNLVHRLHPRHVIHSTENLPLAAGAWAHLDGGRFTLITTMAPDRQVAWWYDDYPERVLLRAPGLEYLVGFNDTTFVAFANGGSYWRTIDGRIDRWEKLTMPSSIGAILRTETKGDLGVICSYDKKAWTFTAGRTWSVDSLKPHERVAITKGGVMYHAWFEPDSAHRRGALIIDRQVGNTRSVVTAIQREEFDVSASKVNGIAYDDNEHRLYIATDHWVRSLSMIPVSVQELPEPTPARSGLRAGYYDLYGRYLGESLPSHIAHGLYLVVTESGTSLRVEP